MHQAKRVTLTGGLVLCTVLGGPAAWAGFPSHNVSLYAHIDLNTFGASSGNDCWGYVSPTGREYALMSVRDKLAFVEITDPANPDWFASISHPSSTWGDVKVYQDVCYEVTERGGTGIQVIDLADIDNHNVTLVRTISAPDTSHNVAVDTASGRLYTCGSNGGAATTVIFDLSDPRNPVQVGTWSDAYEHDAQIVTYTSGPYAGRQIMFGASEGRGVDIVDVTNPASTFLVSRTPYANVSYCHQLWTEDLQYLYVDDELDSIPRTSVFDISDLANPVFMGDFTSGTQAIDHNLYVHNGFVFEANYRSGLRIFDTNVDPVSPPEVGWFDTYPANDDGGFDGAWSVYPFFPSGTCIVSDISDGLFILDVSAAVGSLGETVCPDDPNDFLKTFGGVVSGDAADLCAADDSRLEVRQMAQVAPTLPFVRLEYWAHTSLSDNAIAALTYRVEAHVSALVGGGQNPDTLRTSIRNYATGLFELADQRGTSSSTDELITHVQSANAVDYVQAGDGEIRVRQDVFSPGNVFSPNWFLKVDLYEVEVAG